MPIRWSIPPRARRIATNLVSDYWPFAAALLLLGGFLSVAIISLRRRRTRDRRRRQVRERRREITRLKQRMKKRMRGGPADG